MTSRAALTVTALSIAASAGLARAQVFTEGFEVVPPPGWFMQNNSPNPRQPPWFQGTASTFSAQAGAASSYAACNWQRMTSGAGTLSVWLATPALLGVDNGDTLSFYTRTTSPQFYADRMQVRMNTTGSTNVGSAPEDVGDFTILLADINPGYATTGYPSSWTQYVLPVSGLSGPTTARFAFRYYVENGGPGGSISYYVGVDTASYASAAASGACCKPDGTCADGQSQPQCAALQGAFVPNTACAQAGCPQPGGCCLSDGTCLTSQPGVCTAQGGAFAGAGVTCAQANCPPGGACCRYDSTCSARTQAACAGATGIWKGAGSPCASGCPTAYAYAGAPVPIPDGVAANSCGAIGALSVTVTDSFPITSADAAFFITHGWQGDVKVSLKHAETGTTVYLVDRAGWPGTTYGFGAANYGNAAAGVPFLSSDSIATWYDNAPNGTQTGIASPTGTWHSENPLAAFVGENSAGTWLLQGEDCWNTVSGSLTGFTLFLGRAAGGGCYANCDGSTTAPVANVADFTCFLQKFAASDPYANCDASTNPPVINVADFTCFLQKFAAGCP